MERGLAGSTLQTELRLRGRNKQVKQINLKGQKISLLDAHFLKAIVKKGEMYRTVIASAGPKKEM